MSLRVKKVSAFSVFKGKKASSMSNMEKVAKTPDLAAERRGQSASADTTPTSTYSSNLPPLDSKAEKKKQKADLKKMKKLLKSASKVKRPTYSGESTPQSPLIAGVSNNNKVELRSLRPKGSMTNIGYQLPLKATPEFFRRQRSEDEINGHASSEENHPVVRQGVLGSPIPPLPPRVAQRSRSSTAPSPISSQPSPRSAQKRTSSHRSSTRLLTQPSQTREVLKTQPQQQTQSAAKIDGAPPRPPKRRRLSNGSAPPSPQKAGQSSPSVGGVNPISPKNSCERTEPLPAHPSERDQNVPHMFDSFEEASRLFECLIHPVKPEKFFSLLKLWIAVARHNFKWLKILKKKYLAGELWEKKPLLVKRHIPNYNDGWFSTAELDRILRQEKLFFTENIDITSYINGERETHNSVGRAFPSLVWDQYQNGCSVRVLNPQTYSRNVWKLLSILQEYFGCCAGANIYLTPPGTQGFAPHWDDIEAFLLQLEGKKHWKLYAPRNEEETLPCFSSKNLKQDDVGEPILDVILEAGDLLYFPRGTIHQGFTLEDSHSMHITVSCQQKNTWGDLLKLLVPRALETAMEEDVEFRKSLPRDYLHYMGVAFSDVNNPSRQGFLRQVEQLLMKLLPHAPVDSACDQMGKQFIRNALPPVLTEDEKMCSIHGNGEHWLEDQNRVSGAMEIEPDTFVKIIRKGVMRLLVEDEKVMIYHCLENVRIYQDREPECVEISVDLAPGIEYLLMSYPAFVSVDSIPLATVEEKVDLATSLYDRGLLLTQTPLSPLSESEDEGSADDDDK